MKLDFDNTIYIISGPCGVGKSSVANKLAQNYKLSSHINGDELYNMVVGGSVEPWKDDGQYLELLWSNINSLAVNFIKRGFTVVIDYVVFPEDLKLIKELKDRFQIKIKYIVLIAEAGIIRVRDSLRTENEKMGNRAVELLKEFEDKNIDDRFIINTSLKSIDETVSEIIKEDRFIL